VDDCEHDWVKVGEVSLSNEEFYYGKPKQRWLCKKCWASVWLPSENDKEPLISD
jgi:hypothetical protein